nr:hypothetical protein GCM10025699_06760 [Microbacterium flavescens]
MSTQQFAPVAALDHRGIRRPRRLTADAMLCVYVILLFAVPSNIGITGMGGLGRPSLLWGLALLLWWVLSHLQARGADVITPTQPVRWMLGLLVLVILASFAAAMLRGRPGDQVSPAISSLVRLASWGGVILVAMDGIRTHNAAARVVRVLVVAVGCVSALGVAQFLLGSSLLEWMGSLPGLSYDWGGIDSRGRFTRASGTATHPLEFVSSIVTVLPIAIAAAISGGFRQQPRRRGLWWLIVGLILFICLVSVSRSAIIGLVVALVLVLPWIPRAYRFASVAGGLCIAAAVVVVVPGMWTATLALFVNASADTSTQSRTGALEKLPQFMESSPLIGQGWGTFLSRYYVFDNQWAATLVEIGLLGAFAFAALIAVAVWSSLGASRNSRSPETKVLGGAVSSGLITVTVLLFFFDGLSFPITAGVFVLLLGMAAALRRIALSDAGVRATIADVERAPHSGREGRGR